MEGSSIAHKAGRPVFIATLAGVDLDYRVCAVVAAGIVLALCGNSQIELLFATLAVLRAAWVRLQTGDPSPRATPRRKDTLMEVPPVRDSEKHSHACQKKYEEIKMGKKLRWCTFKIEDKKKIVIDVKEPDMTKKWSDIMEKLPEDQPRYAVMDVDYTSDDGRPQNKLCFVFWSPDDKTTVKDRMLYASSKDAIYKKLTGIMKALQANDQDALSVEEVEKEMKK